jgi:hypothetical protein
MVKLNQKTFLNPERKLMKTIVIDRSKWRTGGDGDNATGNGETKLKNEEGCQCCLGFIASAYKKKTVGCATPASTGVSIPHLTKRNIYGLENTKLSYDAITINDEVETTPKEKEKAIKKLFKGKIDLQFVGEFTKYNDNR